jgi:hypothetical protein
VNTGNNPKLDKGNKERAAHRKQIAETREQSFEEIA